MNKLIKYGLAAFLSLSLVGCSGSNPDSSPTPKSPTPVSTATPSQDSTSSETSSSGATRPSPTEQTKTVRESTKSPVQEHHLTMNIDDSTTKAHFQNGPTAEEIRAYQKRLRSKPVRKKYYGKSGQNAPVYDTEMVEVKG